MSDEEQLHIMGYQTQDLLDERKEAFENKDPQVMNNFLKKYNISYIYLAKGQQMATTSASLKPIFQNSDALILKVEDEKK